MLTMREAALARQTTVHSKQRAQAGYQGPSSGAIAEAQAKFHAISVTACSRDSTRQRLDVESTSVPKRHERRTHAPVSANHLPVPTWKLP